MKKLAIILALLMIPSFAFALDTISDSDLDGVTGQAGVSIIVTSVRIIKSATTTGYGDPDGFTNHGEGWLNIIQTNETTMDIGFHGTEPLKIDIGSMATVVSLTGLNNVGSTGVFITLPNLIEIQASPQLDKIVLNNTPGGDDVTATNGDTLIERYTGGGTTKVVADAFITYGSVTGPYNTMVIITTHDN